MKRFLSIIFIITSYTGLNAQILNPVKWQFKQEAASATNVYYVYFTAQIQSGWHIYSTQLPEGGPIPTSISFSDTINIAPIGKPEELSKKESKYDNDFAMEVGLFSNSAKFRQKVKVLSTKINSIKGYIEYMCCDNSHCLPPKQVEFKLDINPANNNTTNVTVANTTLQKTDNTAPKIAQATNAAKATRTIKETNISSDEVTSDMPLWMLFWSAFLYGLLAVITPCVYPMIPMTVTFFMRNSEHRRQSIIKSMIFGLSIIVIYLLIGIIWSLTGAGASVANKIATSTWLNLLFFALFVVFGISFLGAFEIMLPSSLSDSADRRADKGGYIASFFIALTTIIVSFSCTGPFMVSLLVLSSKGLAIQPIIAMFAYGLAFALPFTLLSLFPTLLARIPKSGGWMNAVKVVFGFLMLAFSLKFLSTIDQKYHFEILTRDVYLAIWISFSVLTGIYILGKIKFAHDSDVPHVTVPRLFFATAAFVFALYLFTGLLGAPLNPLASMLPPSNRQISIQPTNGTSAENTSNSELCNTPKYADIFHMPLNLEAYFDYDEALKCAAQQDKPLLVIFKGHACSNCKQMEANIWPDQQVLPLLKDSFILVALYTDDATKITEATVSTLGEKWLKLEEAKYNSNALPYYVIVNSKEEIQNKPVGFIKTPEKFATFLKQGLIQFRK